MFPCRSLNSPEASSSRKQSCNSTSYEEDNLEDSSCSVPTANTTEPLTGGFQMSDFTNLITLLLKSNRVLHQEMQKMQRDHKKTMTTLMRVCHRVSNYKIPYSDSAGFVHDGNCVVGGHDGVGEVCERHKGKIKECIDRNYKDESSDYLPEEDDDTEDCFQDDGQKHQLSVELTSYSMESGKSFCNEEETNAIHSNPDHFESPGMETVKRMWDTFSMNSHDFEEPVKSKQKKRTPTITIPQPFNMSIREANSPKKKSRSLKVAEQEALKKKRIDDAEINKKFHATPVPTSTFLSIHELSNARNVEKRDILKKKCAKKLESTQKPFSFYERDVLKHKNRAEILKQNQDQEVASLKKNMFKAKRVPPNVFDPETDQKLLEQEEYKAIIKKMRADELIAKSKLPFRTKNTAVLPDKKLECHEGKDFLTEEQCFHPKATHNNPDYEERFDSFPNRPVSKKHCKGTSITEPLQKQTDAGRNYHDKFQTVEDEITQKRIKQKEVSQKTLCKESYLSIEESRRRKMEEFRKNNKLDFWKVQQQLQDMKDRDIGYPFLLEKDTQKPIRRSKEFYISALKESGFGEDKIKNFLQNLQNDSQCMTE